MSKEIDLVKCIISEIDNNLYSDYGGNCCISYTNNLKNLLLALDTPQVRDYFENCEAKDQRIAELEEQLKNAIVPKFKVGQECYVLLGKEIEKITIAGCRIKISKMEDENFTMYSITDIQGYACSVMEEQLFATKQEAEAKLKEMQSE